MEATDPVVAKIAQNNPEPIAKDEVGNPAVDFEEHKVKAVEVTPRCQRHQKKMVWDGYSLVPSKNRHVCPEGCAINLSKVYPCIEFRK
jgi:hypothetical protein